MNSRAVRVRFAPSPTGPLHIGGVRTALYNYLFAKKNKGKCILRIEDTDQTRFVPGAEEYIIESLNWCGIKFDEGIHIGGDYGPYRQSDRKSIYKKYAIELVNRGFAYYAFDSPDDLEEMRDFLKSEKSDYQQYGIHNRKRMNNSLTLTLEKTNELLKNGAPYVIRFKLPENRILKLKDIVRGEIKVNTNTLDDKVLFKSDGMPTYHLANVVDDYLMEISHVIRGEEWLPSLPLHYMLYEAFGWENTMPEFAHMPLTLKPDGKGKLSKRDGDRLGFPVFPIQWKDPKSGEISSGYRESGYLPEAFINILAFLGWNPGTEKEIFSMDELIHAFSLDKISKAGSKFDLDKAKWFNHQYLMASNDLHLANFFMPYLKTEKIEVNINYIAKVIGLIKERANLITDLWEQSHFFFKAPETYDEAVVKKRWREDTPGLMKELSFVIEGIVDFSSQNIELRVKEWIDINELGTGAILNAFRLCIVGAAQGPHLFDIVEMIGKTDTLKRINKAIQEVPVR